VCVWTKKITSGNNKRLIIIDNNKHAMLLKEKNKKIHTNTDNNRSLPIDY
jgi:hypothetical protein